ncbi:hypothetical protein RFI_11988, partial [Reticulomyxa filosa]
KKKKKKKKENMIRDCKNAVSAHGEEDVVTLSQFHLIFEDVQNDTVAAVIFRFIQPDPTKTVVSYDIVLNFLLALKKMRRNCDRELLEKSRYQMVTRREFINLITKQQKSQEEDSDEDSPEVISNTKRQKEQVRELKKQANVIFDRVQEMNTLKVTLTQIRFFMVSFFVFQL